MTDANDLIERLAKIKDAIGAIGKDSQLGGGGGPSYKYRGIEDILNAAHDALVRHQVVIVPFSTEATYELRSRSGGGTSQWVSLKVLWRIACPTGQMEAMTVGEASDTSDKATNKAHTAAFKVLLSQLFAIPFRGDDGDHEREELTEYHEPEISTTQQADIMARIAAMPEYMRDAIRPLVKAQPRKIEHLYACQFDKAMAFLELCEAELEADG